MQHHSEEFWKVVDPDKLAPECHGTPRSADELKRARKELEAVERHNRQYYESIGQEYKSDELFSTDLNKKFPS